MEITRSKAVAICQAVGFKAAGSYSKERLMNRIMTIDSVVDDAIAIGDSDLDNVLDEILHALKTKEEIILVNDAKDKKSKDSVVDEVEVDEEEDADEAVAEDEEEDLVDPTDEEITDTEEEKPKSKSKGKKVIAATKTMRKGSATKTAKKSAKKAAPKKRRIEVIDDTPAKASKPTKKAGKAAATKAKANAKGTRSRGGKVSLIEAAASLLASSKKPMTTKEMIEALAKRGIWSSPGGATPDRTLYSAILRDIGTGKNSRFKKVDRGQFAAR